ncbi:hypothetical protein M3Y99_01801500 [Aphelenchoides fujianensis]|nr:hypothetical protein M3Y99_01801500 [Aphelenchoides fujianensis]
MSFMIHLICIFGLVYGQINIQKIPSAPAPQPTLKIITLQDIYDSIQKVRKTGSFLRSASNHAFNAGDEALKAAEDVIHAGNVLSPTPQDLKINEDRRHDREETGVTPAPTVQELYDQFEAALCELVNTYSKFCAIKRRLYVVRHAEREDNVNRDWQRVHQRFTKDNSPLSDRGRRQAEELREYFKDITIDETATILLGGHPNHIQVEPGRCEALYLCQKPQPGFWPMHELVQKFERVDMDYKPVFPPPMPKEGMGDEGRVPRLEKTIDTILARCPESRVNGCFASNIVPLRHGASITAIHYVLISDFSYVGQATVSIFDEKPPGSRNYF